MTTKKAAKKTVKKTAKRAKKVAKKTTRRAKKNARLVAVKETDFGAVPGIAMSGNLFAGPAVPCESAGSRCSDEDKAAAIKSSKPSEQGGQDDCRPIDLGELLFRIFSGSNQPAGKVLAVSPGGFVPVPPEKCAPISVPMPDPVPSPRPPLRRAIQAGIHIGTLREMLMNFATLPPSTIMQVTLEVVGDCGTISIRAR